MKTLLITLAALTLLSCDPIKRHQRLVRKHPHLLETISTPKTDTVRIENTKYIECPDGTKVKVDCDTLIIYETNTITLPPTNAQIRQQERTKRNFEDNVRKMYADSLKQAERIYRLENQRLKDQIREYRKINRQNQKTARTETRSNRFARFISFAWIILFFVLLMFFFRRK